MDLVLGLESQDRQNNNSGVKCNEAHLSCDKLPHLNKFGLDLFS